MDRLNFSDLYRFLVSLGVVAIVLAFVVPWLVLRDGGSNIYYQDNFETLTESSKIIATGNQELQLLVIDYLPYIVLFLLSFGTYSISYGFIRWKKKQKEVDELDNIDLLIRRMEVPTLSVEESKKKAKKESQEIFNATESKGDKQDQEESSESWKELLSVEEKVYKILIKNNPPNFKLQKDVNMNGKIADLVLQSYTNDKLDRLVEVKYFENEITTEALVNTLHQMNRFALTYINTYKKKMRGFIVVVYNEQRTNVHEAGKFKAVISSYIKENKLNFIAPYFIEKNELENYDFSFLY